MVRLNIFHKKAPWRRYKIIIISYKSMTIGVRLEQSNFVYLIVNYNVSSVALYIKNDYINKTDEQN